MTAPASLAPPLAPAEAPDREEVRRRVAALLQWACARFPATIAADDSKALVVAELVMREVEGRQD
jgi:hypothetical protein